MNTIEIYTHPGCSHCNGARRLLLEIGETFTEYNVARDQARLHELRQRTSETSFPQIFVNGENIGGYTDLLALDL